MKRAKIIGTGSYLPSKILTNQDLEKIVDTSDEWIIKRTGIQERRIADPAQAASDLGVEAARAAILDAGIDKQDIDLIICATITPDMVFPATACLIKEKLGIEESGAFDVEAACTGFITALSIAEGMLLSENYRNILVVASEVLSRVTDWEDRGTCVLFGDGSGAAILSLSEDGRGIISTHLGADGSYADLLKLPAGGSAMPATETTLAERMHFMKMEGREVFKIAVQKMGESCCIALERAGLDISDVKIVVPHQANMRIIQALARQLKLEKDKVFVNIMKYGNMSAATTAVGLDEVRQGKMAKDGDIVELVAFGGGLTWGAAVVKI